MAQWDKITERGNVQDRRGSSGLISGGFGIVGTIAIVGFVLLTGGSAQDVLQVINDFSPSQSQSVDGIDDGYDEFASTILGSNNALWEKELAARSITYEDPTLVLFRNQTNSGCGIASSDIGPHYCPRDNTIYLDETFFEELTTRFGARGGEVAQAYVMSHEVGHHVQNLTGELARTKSGDNEDSIAVELQADCYAGYWSGTVKSQGVITADEIGQALDAASAVGDDRIQQSTSGNVNPETWTHGSSVQRKSAFLKGFNASSSTACNFVS